jgi:(4S)-4-hydroxy-5-phosphonooxypentane-2,3-dione isomerase
MRVLLVEFVIKAESVKQFELALIDNAHKSLTTEPGCKQFDVCRDPADPTQFVLYELYDDDAAIREHLQSAHFKAFDALVRDWIVSKRVATLDKQWP